MDRGAGAEADDPDGSDGSGTASPWLAADVARGAAYDLRFERLASSGTHVHGEADLVTSLAPATVLDAGCGTGRVAIELDRRGVEVVGVDLDPEMLSRAREKAPALAWHQADLARLDLGRRFDLVLAAGNVMVFLAPGAHGAVLRALARHLGPGGLLLAGFSLGDGRLDPGTYDELASDAGLTLVARWSTWEREPYSAGATYAVSLHALEPARDQESRIPGMRRPARRAGAQRA